jgi:hypothetical protein
VSNVGEVFVPGGLPSVTYVPRESVRLETLVEDYIDEGLKILSVSGQTKSGKTVLVRKAIPDLLELSGGDIATVQDFWSGVVDKLGAYPEVTKQVTEQESTSRTREISGGLKVPVAELKGGGGSTSGLTDSRTHTVAKSRPNHLLGKDGLMDLRDEIVLFIDDFHYIPTDVQLAIVRALKSLVFDGLRVVFASVPHRAFDAVRIEKEMTGRVEQLPIPLWDRAELQSIARRGFEELNVYSNDADIERLAREAFRSPHLMQDFCLQYCKTNELRATQDEPRVLKSPSDWKLFFRDRAPSASKFAFDLLAKGPPRTDRIPRRLKDGTQTDIYGAVLAAIAWTGPVTELPYDQLRTALREVLESELPQLHEVTRVLVAMSKIAREKLQGEPVVDYDEDYQTLHISDPFFAFYLRWGTEVQAQPLRE